jgi:RNA polymerase sigma-70 factor (ECF subfamily)
VTRELRDFPETRWSQLLQIRDPGQPGYAERLEDLIRRYWTPAYHYLRAIRPGSAQDAEDRVQQFFAMLLTRGSLDQLSPDRGSFRSFLKTALRRWAVSADRHESARSPRDGARLFRFDEAEALWKTLSDRNLGPEEAFDREWARSLLAESMARLEKELGEQGKGLTFRLFRDYCLEGDESVSYAELARRHGVSEDDVRNGLRAVRQRGRDLLREMLRDTLLPGEDLEQELRLLLSR